MSATRRVEVEAGENVVAVRARGHTWVALLDAERELAREEGGGEATTFAAAPGRYVVQTDGELSRVRGETLELEEPGDEPTATLQLTTDAPDQHVVDGVGEVPADGASYCTITVEKHDAAGQPLTRRRDSDEVFVRATGGTLEDERGRRVRAIRLRAGRAQFRLVSEAQPRLVVVEVLGHPPLVGAELRVEFV